MHACEDILCSALMVAAECEHYGVSTGGHDQVHRAEINQQYQQSAIRCRRKAKSRIIIAITRPKFDGDMMHAHPLGVASLAPPRRKTYRDLLGGKTNGRAWAVEYCSAFGLAKEYPDLAPAGHFCVSEWRPDTTLCGGPHPL